MHLLTLLKMNLFSSTSSNKTVKNTFIQQETCALQSVISAIQRLAHKNRRVACCRIYLESLCKAHNGTSGFLLQTCMMQFLQDFENGLSRSAETGYYATLVSGAAAYSQGITVTLALPSTDFNPSVRANISGFSVLQEQFELGPHYNFSLHCTTVWAYRFCFVSSVKKKKESLLQKMLQHNETKTKYSGWSKLTIKTVPTNNFCR